MKGQIALAKQIKRKPSFGTAAVDHFSPTETEYWPKTINITLSFEETLKLHLGLGQMLGRLNEYNRSTKEGRRSAVDLCLFTGDKQITINQGQVK